ncbi:MAG: N-acetylglucosamine-6-phosphate deacetylase [Candidatus Caldatribacteriaceae bacterium]
MGRPLIVKGRVVTPNRVLQGGMLLVQKGRIEEVILPEDAASFFGSKGSECVFFDCSEFYLFPGLIDLHVHGARGADFMDGDPEGVQRIADFLLQEGVTRFLATTMTERKERILSAIRTVVVSSRALPSVLGIHLEGPYLSQGKRGAHSLSLVRPPNIREMEEFLEAGDGLIKRVTIAPEVEGALAMVAHLASLGILVSLGHSKADYATGFRAYFSGARLITHVFNGMEPLHHRRPNLLAFALSFEGIWAEVIADGIHIAPEVLQILFACKPHRTIVVSDAIRATGMGDGVYELGGEAIRVEEGVARVVSSGSLAGSTTSLRRALFNLRKIFDFPLPYLASLGSLYPARLLGMEDTLGSLEKGRKADIVVFDEAFNVRGVFLEGEKRF